MPDPAHHYALIIPAWNEEAFIGSALACARDAMQTVAARGQLIVVDNNSTDNTAAVAAAGGATVVFEAVNQISRARNAGANAADAAVYVFVDADSAITGPLLQRALDLLAADTVVGGGALVAPDRPVARTIAVMMGLWNTTSRVFKLAAGCFVFVRADAFHAVGGFSEKRYAGEELVLSRLLRRWGRKQGLRFVIITEHRMITSMRKADWYSPVELCSQALLVLLPGALNSKRFLKTWYDADTQRSRDSQP